MLGLGGETVTILTPDTAVNRYGRTTSDPDWSGAAETEVPGCLFAPTPGTENLDGRTATVTTARLYLPADSTLTASSRVEIRGETWEVDGDPAHWVNPMGGPGGIEAPLRKVVG